MKNFFLIFTFLFLVPTVVKAIPFVVNNNSDNSVKPGKYSTKAFLYYTEEFTLFNSLPGICPSPHAVLALDLHPGDTYSIADGNSGSPFCLGENISSSCNVKLGWFGVRAGEYYNMEWDVSFGIPYRYYGLVVISYAFPCFGGNPNPVTGPGINFISTAASYELETNAMKMRFNTYGMTLSTMLYE